MPVVNPSINLVRHSDNKTWTEPQVLLEMRNKNKAAMRLSDKAFSKKNLIYFTINYNEEYVELFLRCINNLNKHSHGSSYDILIITCDRIKKKIQGDNRFKYRAENVYFHVVPEAVDGIAASMNKLKIYAWDRIDNYGRVLFLDVDIMCINNISRILSLPARPGILHSTIHMAQQHLHQTVYHRLLQYSMTEMNWFKEKDVYAFNAGQFMFINSPRMLAHMAVVDWMTRVWPGAYFFEQSYMNHYFNGFALSDVQLLLPTVWFLAVHLGPRAIMQPHISIENATCIHFSGHACDCQFKLDFINQYYPNL